MWARSSNANATRVTAPHAWRRQLHLMLDAYRAERAHPIPEPPMTSDQLYDGMVALSKTGVAAAGTGLHTRHGATQRVRRQEAD
jgi:hypothetical protein